MTPTIKVTNPEPGHMPPLPGPGDVNLEWVPVEVVGNDGLTDSERSYYARLWQATGANPEGIDIRATMARVRARREARRKE